MPELNKVADEKGVTIYYIDSADEENADFQKEYGITSVPFLAYYSGGKIIDTTNNPDYEDADAATYEEFFKSMYEKFIDSNN